MYEDFAFGAFHAAEQESVTERAEQTARFVQVFRDWRDERRRRRDRRRRNAYTTAA